MEKLRPLIAEDLRDRVHALDRFWLPDEAAWVYERAALLFSAEMHSIIMALAAGTPCVMFRLQGTGDAADALAAGLSQEEHIMSDGLKNRMMEDLGLGDWLFYRSEDARIEDVANRLLHIHRNPEETAGMLRNLKARVKEHQADSMATVEKVARRG
jgi:polysaccharide pyruvyl transferase WcaK-like protein